MNSSIRRRIERLEAKLWSPEHEMSWEAMKAEIDRAVVARRLTEKHVEMCCRLYSPATERDLIHDAKCWARDPDYRLPAPAHAILQPNLVAIRILAIPPDQTVPAEFITILREHGSHTGTFRRPRCFNTLQERNVLYMVAKHRMLWRLVGQDEGLRLRRRIHPHDPTTPLCTKPDCDAIAHASRCATFHGATCSSGS